MRHLAPIVLLGSLVPTAPVVADGLEYRPLATITVEFVAEIRADRGAVANVVARSPLPLEWPGQKVELVKETVTPGARLVVRGEKGVAAWMEITATRIPAGGRVIASRIYRIERSAISTTLPIEELETVAKPSRALKRLLSSDPGVEPRDRRVRELVGSLVERTDPAGARAAAFASWIRENVRYEAARQFRGTVTCIRGRVGDCDDMSAVFVSLCRSSGIPARTVWVEGHGYAEFLLVDGEGTEHWVPFDPAGTSPLGTVRNAQPILQKGDGFLDPFTRRRVHYVPQGVRASGAPVSFRSERRIVTPSE